MYINFNKHFSRRCRNPHFNCGPRKNFCTPIPRKACETDCSENFYKNEKIRGKSAFRKVSKFIVLSELNNLGFKG